jgi:hypothetical protein
MALMPRFLLSAAICLGLALPAAAQLRINSTTSGYQQCPSVLATPAGDYIVIFSSRFGSSRDGVLAQRIGPFGEKIGPELSLDSGQVGGCPVAVASGPGRFLVTWAVDDVPELSVETVYARHFDFEGRPLGPRFKAGESFLYLPSDAVCDAEGRCWIAWIGKEVDSVHMRRFAFSGEPLGEEIRVDSPGPFERYRAHISSDSHGGFVVAWWIGDTTTGTPEDPPPPPNGEIHFRRFSAAGEPLGGEILVGSDPAFAHYRFAACHGADGSLFVSGVRVSKDDRREEIFLRRFDASGAPAGPEKRIAGSERAWTNGMACSPDGSVLLLWTALIEDALFGLAVNSAGEPVGAPFLIAQDGGPAHAALLGPGRFLAAWSRYVDEPLNDEVFGRAYHTELQLPMRQGRFRIDATFRNPQTGQTGQAHAIPLTDETGLLWFFNSSNVELVVKLLDGCGVNGHFWFFAAGLTDVEVEITVTDSTDGSQKQYRNPPKTAFLPIQDTRALACH